MLSPSGITQGKAGDPIGGSGHITFGGVSGGVGGVETGCSLFP